MTVDHRKWDTVLQRIAHKQAGQQDASISTKRMTYLGNKHVKLPTRLDMGYRVASLTKHSMSQLTSHLGVPNSFIDELEQRNPNLANEVMNDALQTSQDKLFWRFSEDRIRGVLPSKRPAADNLAIVEGMDSALSIGSDDDFFVRSVSLDDNRFYLKVLFDKEFRDSTGIEEGNYLKVGVLARTSETAYGKIEIKPFMYRWSCTNDAVVSTSSSFITQDFSIDRHRLIEEASHVAASSRMQAIDWVSSALDSQKQTVRSPQRRLQSLASEAGLTKAETKSLISAYRKEPMPTVYGMSQAFTRYAQTISDLDDRSRIEEFGATIALG